MNTTAKFIQIMANNGELFGLDAEGQVWEWFSHEREWRRISMRRAVGEK